MQNLCLWLVSSQDVKKNSTIPLFREINDFLEGIHSTHRTKDPLFFCLRMEDTYPHTRNVMPPFKKDFYFISFITNAGSTAIRYDQSDESHLDCFLVCQSPGHVYSWHRDKEVKGYLIYFKKELFSFFRPDLETEFPFFNILQTNFFRINQVTFKKYEPVFQRVFEAYHASKGSRRIAAVCLLELLYQLKDFAAAAQQWRSGFSTPQEILYQQFLQLINNYYLEKRTVEEYAELLNLTPKYLSQAIKQATGKNALSYINDRLVAEAKTLIRFTALDVAEIAWQLNFSDPANFGKFFKKQVGLTPLEYRKSDSA